MKRVIICFALCSIFTFLTFVSSFHSMCTFVSRVDTFLYPPESILFALLALKFGYTSVISGLKLSALHINTNRGIQDIAFPNSTGWDVY